MWVMWVTIMAMLNLGAFSLNPIYVGDVAKSSLFGANFLFNRDGSSLTGIDDNYRTFIQEAQLSTLRYPGGTLTETHLDLAKPDSTSANYMDPGSQKVKTVPLTEFLQLCKATGTTATIVLPTYRFLSDAPDASGHRQIDKSEEANLRSFIKFALETAQALGVKIAAFEVGNEWYIDNSATFGFRMSPVEYGRIANYMCAIAQQEMDKPRLTGSAISGAEPAIVVQVGPGGDKELYTPSGFRPTSGYTGPTVTATQLIAQQFTDAYAKAAVDGILMHRYMTVSDERAGAWVYNPFLTWAAVTASLGGFKPAVDQYVTEWNVSARNTNERGIAQFDSMFEMLREMLLVGVDHANVWAVQQNNRTRMIANTGTDGAQYGGLTYGGLAFDIASAQLRDLKTLKTPESISGISINAFGNSNRSVTVLTNRTDAEVSHTVNLAKVIKSGHHATIYHIREGVDGKPTVQVETINITSASLNYILAFGGQESIVIVIAAGQSGSTIEGYDQNDRLTGSAFGDSILGGDGNDSCRGAGGGDLIQGETGQDTLFGDDGNDTLDGGIGGDRLDGGSGNDLLFWSPGGDTIIGGGGEDTVSFERKNAPVLLDLASPQSLEELLNGAVIREIEGFAGSEYGDTLLGDRLNNLLLGGAGEDLISGGEGNDRLFGERGSDSVFGDWGNDSLYGGESNDFLDGGSGIDLIDGGDGDDAIFGGTGNDTASGGVGNDTLNGGTGDDRILGGDGEDSIAGENGNDFLLGDGGSDIVFGGDGRDSIFGGSGRDTLWGDSGNDLLDGGEGGDRVLGGDGSDSMLGGVGDDFLFGGADADTIDGGNGDDVIYGDNGADRLIGSDGTDNVFGGIGDDIIFGGNGGDLLRGDEGNDLIYGDSGNDHLIGGAGNDALYGGSGNDVIVGGPGTNALYGGKGLDTFVFGDSAGISRVMDFKDNEDTLLFRGSFLNIEMTARQFVDTYARQVGGLIVFDFGDAGALTVSGLASVRQLYDDVTLLT